MSAKRRSHTRALLQAIRTATPSPKLGVEVGVWRADNAYWLLTDFPDLVLYLVDPYVPHHGEGRMQQTVEEARKEAHERLAPFAERCRWVYLPSNKAHVEIPDGALDFGFLDGNHRSRFVAEDIREYIKKIHPGGILAGHDYGGPHRGVKGAVDRAFQTGVHVGRGRVWWVKV